MVADIDARGRLWEVPRGAPPELEQLFVAPADDGHGRVRGKRRLDDCANLREQGLVPKVIACKGSALGAARHAEALSLQSRGERRLELLIAAKQLVVRVEEEFPQLPLAPRDQRQLRRERSRSGVQRLDLGNASKRSGATDLVYRASSGQPTGPGSD